HFLLNLWRRSLADRDSRLPSLRGLCGERSSGQQAPGHSAWPPLFLFLFLLVAWTGRSSLLAQDSSRKEYTAGKVARIGYLRVASPQPRQFEAFREGLKVLGYIEGQNIAIEQRH